MYLKTVGSMVEWYLSLNPTVNPLPFHLIPRDQLGSALDLRRGAHDPPFLAFLRLQICDQGAISQQMFSFPTPASAAEKKAAKISRRYSRRRCLAQFRVANCAQWAQQNARHPPGAQPPIRPRSRSPSLFATTATDGIKYCANYKSHPRGIERSTGC